MKSSFGRNFGNFPSFAPLKRIYYFISFINEFNFRLGQGHTEGIDFELCLVSQSIQKVYSLTERNRANSDFYNDVAITTAYVNTSLFIQIHFRLKFFKAGILNLCQVIFRIPVGIYFFRRMFQKKIASFPVFVPEMLSSKPYIISTPTWKNWTPVKKKTRQEYIFFVKSWKIGNFCRLV